MRRVLVAFVVLVLLASTGRSSAAADPTDVGLASAPSEAVDQGSSRESLPLRLGKAAVFAVVASALLLAGGVWRRRRRTPSERRK